MTQPSLAALFAAYPRDAFPCYKPYQNQCAIRLSLAINGEGTFTVSTRTYDGKRCPHGHARGAEHLAGWLSNRRRLGRPQRFRDSAVAKQTLQTQGGIIFFKDCFERLDYRGRMRWVGDHIDLWVSRARQRIYASGVGAEDFEPTQAFDALTYNDPDNASVEVWFWPLA